MIKTLQTYSELKQTTDAGAAEKVAETSVRLV